MKITSTDTTIKEFKEKFTDERDDGQAQFKSSFDS
jgi:hypothetical protein